MNTPSKTAVMALRINQMASSWLSDDIGKYQRKGPGLLFQSPILGCEECWSEQLYRDGGEISEA